MVDYCPSRCSYCDTDTWCELRSDKSRQCRACKVERFFERVLYPPLGFKLLDWTRKLLREIYGTVDEITGFRCYQECYISSGKQQGKSLLEGGLPLYHLLMENEFQPEAYGVASARDQADIVFRAAQAFVDPNPFLQQRLKVLGTTKRIVRKDGGGFYAVLSADGKVQDGKRPSLLLVDELHRFERKSAETVLSVLRKGFVSRIKVQDGVRSGEPLKVTVTTAGSEHESPVWYSEYQYAQKVIAGSIQDPKYFARIWQADAKRVQDDPEYWKSREARVAASPSHQDNGGFVADSSIEDEMKKAILKPETKGDYIRLHLNVPVDITATPIMDMSVWQQGDGGVDLREWPEYDVELLISKWGLAGRTCFAGIDLSWTTDFSALALLFPPEKSEDPWRSLMFFWLPEGRIPFLEERTKMPLRDWVRRGFLSTCPTNQVDMAAIIEKVKWASRMFDVREVTFDKWGGIKAACNLMLVPEGFTCIEIPQTYGGLTSATKYVLSMYLDQKLAHGNNPILNWNASCLALASDGGANCKPVKPKHDATSARIDGMAALITAMARAEFMVPQEANGIEVW